MQRLDQKPLVCKRCLEILELIFFWDVEGPIALGQCREFAHDALDLVVLSF
jgi:hypothetical protein